MKVCELIEKLGDLDPELPVFVSGDGQFLSGGGISEPVYGINDVDKNEDGVFIESGLGKKIREAYQASA